MYILYMYCEQFGDDGEVFFEVTIPGAMLKEQIHLE